MVRFSVAAIAELLRHKEARGVELGIPSYVAQGALAQQLREAFRRAQLGSVELRMVEAPEICVLRIKRGGEWGPLD
ncbi:MAG: hypothetical protein VX899_09230 [Myxococcota bacterium]|nr:hypothetical protein [Myxococcota bacterium]